MKNNRLSNITNYLGLGNLIFDKSLETNRIFKALTLKIQDTTELTIVRKYKLRNLYPPTLKTKIDALDFNFIEQVLPEIFSVYWYVYRRKLEFGRKITREELCILILTLKIAKTILYYSTSDTEVVWNLAKAKLPAEIFNELIESIFPRLSCRPGKNLKQFPNFVLLLQAINSNESVFVPSYRSTVKELFIKLIVEKEIKKLKFILETIFKDFFDIQTGLFVQEKVAEIKLTNKTSKKFYISAIVLLAIVQFCRNYHLKLFPIATDQTISLKSFQITREVSSDESYQNHKLINQIEWLRYPPKLNGSLEPEFPNSHLWKVERLVHQVLENSFLEEYGLAWKLFSFDPSKKFVFSIRHDVDRPLIDRIVSDIVSFEQSLGIRSSWFFKPETFNEEIANYLVERGFEIGYHASHIHNGDFEFAQYLRQKYSSKCVGCTFHGGIGSSYWTGLYSIEQSAKLGFKYTEMLTEFFPHPYCLVTRHGEIFLTPLSVKYDAFPDWVDAHLNLIERSQGYAIIENHPDLFSKDFKKFIIELLKNNLVCRTIGEHITQCQQLNETQVDLSKLSQVNASLRIIHPTGYFYLYLSLHKEQFTQIQVEGGKVIGQSTENNFKHLIIHFDRKSGMIFLTA